MTILRVLYRYWMKFAHVLGWVNGRILLTLLYFLVVGPYAIVRMIGRIFRSRKSPESYWIKKEPVDASLESLRRIF